MDQQNNHYRIKDTKTNWMLPLVNTQEAKEKNAHLIKKALDLLNNLTLHQKE